MARKTKAQLERENAALKKQVDKLIEERRSLKAYINLIFKRHLPNMRVLYIDGVAIPVVLDRNLTWKDSDA